MTEPNPQLSSAERYEWSLRIQAANLYNLLHHCRQCDRQWIASIEETCQCGSTNLERIACWQFPDD